ncbi:sensor domain-containing protein [Mycobacterium sp. smrl_JER01]|uniref:sensor domain-containing protein n=1 Tax=Mycobacterium sp. smrl_JER01 TaxID=3402633 RepID=UPI003AC98CDD
MTGRASASLWCAAAILVGGCTHHVAGTALRPVPAIDEDSQSPVDVDSVLLDRGRLQAVTGAGEHLTMVPGTESKVPVDIDFMMESVPAQCEWVYAESQVFGSEVEEFHKQTYQNPPGGALISQAAAGYRDAPTARRAFDAVAEQIAGCDATQHGPALVGGVTRTTDSVHTRPGGCGRDYQVKSAVLVEITFCAFPASVSDIVMTNILANVPG